MFRKLLSTIFGPRAQAAEPEANPTTVRGIPDLQEPILLFMESAAFVGVLSSVPSWTPIHVQSFREFCELLPKSPYSMLIALSPTDDSGSAAKAIQAFREKNPEGLTVYHGTDYRILVSGPRALACKADALMLGGVLDWNLVFFLGTATLLKRRNRIEPSLELYTKLLETTCKESPFWTMQDLSAPPCDVD